MVRRGTVAPGEFPQVRLAAIPAGESLQDIRDKFGMWNGNRLWQDNILSERKITFFIVGKLYHAVFITKLNK